jgi:hypothetical protein
MIDSSPWITPLLLMPGVALLILSTAVRYNRLHDEVHNAVGHDGEHAGLHEATLAYRARRFCNALVGLYLAVSLIALAALSGVAAVVGLKFGSWVGIGLTGLSVMAILYSSTQLIREARRSLEVIEQHLES